MNKVNLQAEININLDKKSSKISLIYLHIPTLVIALKFHMKEFEEICIQKSNESF